MSSYNIKAFDFDKEFYRAWKRFDYDPAVEVGVKESVKGKFKQHIDISFADRKSVSFETNYHSNVTEYLIRASSNKYKTELIFIGLKDVSLARERVDLRVSMGGHFVDKRTIEERYYAGLKQLDKTFHLYDSFTIIESLPGYDSRLCVTGDHAGLEVKEFPSFMDHLSKLRSLIDQGV